MSTRTLSGLGLTFEIAAVTGVLPSLFDGDELEILGPGVVGRGADDLAVDALLDHVRRPAGGARDHEERREHRSRHAHDVVARRAVPVEAGEHLLLSPHHFLDAR